MANNIETGDFPGDITTPGTVDVNGDPATGVRLTTTDDDWYAVQLTADERYIITNTAGLMPVLYDSTGHQVSAGHLFEFDFTVYRPEVSGTFYIGADDPLGWEDNRAYQISIATLPDDYLDSYRTNAFLGVGETVTGTSEISGDEDWFELDLSAGQTYVFHGGYAPGSTKYFTPDVRIYDANGNVIGDDGPNDGTVLFTAGMTGTYYVSIGEADPTEGFGSTWKLSMDTVSGSAPQHILDWIGSSDLFHVEGTDNSETIYGSQFAEVIRGHGGTDRVFGYRGDDWINASGMIDGGWGNDKIIAGRGDDVLIGDWGDDDISLGGGADRVIWSDADGHDIIRGFGADDTLEIHTEVYASVEEMLAAADVRSDRIIINFDEGDRLVLLTPEIDELTSGMIDFTFEGSVAPL